MKLLPVVTRLLIVASVVVVVAVAVTFFDAAGRGPINPFNFFGFFTVQANSLKAIALLIAAVLLLRGRSSNLADYFRGAATTYIAAGGIAYALLLAPLGEEGGIPIPWANVVLHIVVPVYAPLDWLLFDDRRRLALRRLWTVLIYPVIWLAVVLTRGATDGWFPYPFLDPANGYGSIALISLGILVVAVIIGALVFWVSRLRLIQVGVRARS